MKNYAVITWASSGIGKEFAEIFAKDGHNLVLVARSLLKLQSIKSDLEKTYKIEVIVLEKDLSLENSAKEIYTFTKAEHLRIDYLVNNAGFGDYGEFATSDDERNNQMLQLNIVALTRLTRYYIEDMKKHNFWKILNVASTAAFQPGPYMAVYFATKAYVKSFSLAIASELEDTKITITTLCPGPTASEFEKNANATEVSIFKWKLPSSYEVALFGYHGMMKGKKLVIHGLVNRIQALSAALMPTSMMLKMMKFMMGRKD
jgi:uncharacterized protein